MSKPTISVISFQEGKKNLFTEAIPSNDVRQLGIFSLVPETDVSISYAITEGGALFPWQYHEGGNELAIVIEGEGAIELGDDEGVTESFPFKAGDIVTIPANVLYRVRNLHPVHPLKALVCFPTKVKSFWQDGSSAEREQLDGDA